MTWISVIFILIALGLIAYGVQRWLPMPEPYRTVINIVILIVAIVVLLHFAGVIGSVRI